MQYKGLLPYFLAYKPIFMPQLGLFVTLKHFCAHKISAFVSRIKKGFKSRAKIIICDFFLNIFTGGTAVSASAFQEEMLEPPVTPEDVQHLNKSPQERGQTFVTLWKTYSQYFDWLESLC